MGVFLQSAVSYLCGNGMIEMLELLGDIPGIDFDLADTEGNAPLHFAAQAGHVEVVSFLLNKAHAIQVDPINKLGFTPLMKAAIQGRVKCSKLLLFSGKQRIGRKTPFQRTSSKDLLILCPYKKRLSTK